MSLPFVFIEDKNSPNGMVCIFDTVYKRVRVGKGEPPRFKEVIDWDAIAKASAEIVNITPNDR